MSSVADLPSWRPGATRDALLSFLATSAEVPVDRRVACFDNDGTLWCERPTYAQFDFFVDALRRRVATDPAVGEREELAAVLRGDPEEIAGIGLDRIAVALASLFEGRTPEEFAVEARSFLARAVHSTLDRPLADAVYQPMLELVAALRERRFTVAIVTGGGMEFVRAVSTDLYGVPPELVVGTDITYELARDGDDPVLRRTAQVRGRANEGEAKVAHIQAQLGRRPILAAGNSGGDQEMLEWATAADGPHLALVVDHDDADREFSYVGRAETFAQDETLTDVAARRGWTVASMARDWETVFTPTSPAGAPTNPTNPPVPRR